MAILKETKDAQASQRAAAELQKKLVNTLAGKLPKVDMGAGNYNTAVKEIKNLVDSSNYKGARDYVTSQLKIISGQKAESSRAEAAARIRSANQSKAESAAKDLEFKNKPKLDKDRGPYYGS